MTRSVELTGSHRSMPRDARRLGPVAGDETLHISLYLKSRGQAALPAGRDALAASRASVHAADIDAVTAFANANGLTVTESSPARRLVRLSGTASAFQAAFHTELHSVEHLGVTCRMREGSLQIPANLQPMVESVLGLDNRPVAQPRFVIAPRAAVATSHLPNELGRLYNFPTGVDGTGHTIAIVELGGGYNDADNTQAFQAMGLKTPTVTAVSVDGATNSTGTDADGEVALDIQVAGGIAPGAGLVVYFTTNTDQGFADAISQAAHDTANAPSVISISWGGPESGYAAQAVTTLNSVMQDAGMMGVSVFVASGDSLATDGLTDGAAHVDFPASSPYAIGCGGTNITTDGATITAETVWDDGDSGTGGGISDLFDVPSFQSGVTLPPSVNAGRKGRGVPDVAGDAAPASGYTIVLNGQNQTVGGTSAVAPLWSGLTALINQSTGRNAGFFLPALYADPSGLREIMTGNNKPEGTTTGYDAGPNWNACTGLGRPDGQGVLATLSKAATV
jgi:kumamolisin